MKVYIIYDRYEHDEWYDIYNICKSVDEVKKVYKQSLIDFCMYGPDDCHSFQCQEVELNEDQLKILEDYMNGSDSDEGYDLMYQIYDDCRWCQYPDTNCLFCTDGCSDNIEVFEEYMKEQHPDVREESDEWFDLQEEFYGDEKLCETELRKYIDRHYQL